MNEGNRILFDYVRMCVLFAVRRTKIQWCGNVVIPLDDMDYGAVLWPLLIGIRITLLVSRQYTH